MPPLVKSSETADSIAQVQTPCDDGFDCYCRVGRNGEIGRFRNSSEHRFSRGQSVVVRTARGLEIGHVLRSAPAGSDSTRNSHFDGKILRPCSSEDKLLSRNLEEAARGVFDDCRDYLERNRLDDCLLDVEALLDARTLYFYFLGAPSEAIGPELEKLAAIFQEKVRSSQFAKLLEEGCGPGCGTEEKGGCGTSGACSVCVVATACKQH